MVPVYVITCDKHIQFMKPFMYAWDKFVPSITPNVICFDVPDFLKKSRANIISLGKDPGPESWSKYLHDYFATQTFDHFFLILEDCILKEKIDIEKLETVSRLCKEHSISRFHLTSSIDGKQFEGFCSEVPNSSDLKLIKLGDVSHQRNHRSLLGLNASIYHRETFVEYCVPTCTPWQMEQGANNTRASKDPNFTVFSLDHAIVKYSSVCRTEGAHGRGPKLFYAAKDGDEFLEMPDWWFEELMNSDALDYWKQHGSIRREKWTYKDRVR